MSENRALQPTAKRRRQARQEGRVAASSQVVGAVLWLGMAAVTLASGPAILVWLSSPLEHVWSQPYPGLPAELPDRVRETILSVGMTWWPLLGLIFSLAVCARLAQTGFLWAPSRLQPNTQRLNSTRRLAELFSADKLFQILRGIALILCALLLVGAGIWQQREALVQLLTSTSLPNRMVTLLARWGLRLGGCLAIFAAADYAYQRYRFERSLRMSPEELRAEVKAVERNPQVTAERKVRQQQFGQRPPV